MPFRRLEMLTWFDRLRSTWNFDNRPECFILFLLASRTAIFCGRIWSCCGLFSLVKRNTCFRYSTFYPFCVKIKRGVPFCGTAIPTERSWAGAGSMSTTLNERALWGAERSTEPAVTARLAPGWSLIFCSLRERGGEEPVPGGGSELQRIRKEAYIGCAWLLMWVPWVEPRVEVCSDEDGTVF